MTDSTLFEYMRAEYAENWRLRDLREVMARRRVWRNRLLVATALVGSFVAGLGLGALLW